MDLTCGHCAGSKPIEHEGNVVIDRSEQEVEHYGTIYWDTIVAIYRCPACDEATVWQYVWSDAIGDAFQERRLYPTIRDNRTLPSLVNQRLLGAMKVKKIEPGLYAVGIRRVLETVCNLERASGDDLFEKLDDLAKKNRIPATLAQMAQEVRKFGNLGAHDNEIEVAPEDVSVIEDFAEAILEYLYRAPAKLAAAQAGLDQRKKQARQPQTAT